MSTRRDVVMLREESEQSHLHVVEIARRADVIEATFAERPPEALHLASSLWVVRRRVQEADAQARASRRQDVTGVGRAIVEVERLGAAADAPHRFHQ